ncbi:isochorismate synthase [Gordonia sp. TBRC 11910]|uniref:isochorismate synthase n=1 Tax=Gordonia asplenii TaxID=2725283 RepID=A0A848L4T9_9ACTN|nr:isochorismate synthase [Gordonia asplenii]
MTALGVDRAFPKASDAAAAARAGRMIVGAIGFDPDSPAALFSPRSVVRSDRPVPSSTPRARGISSVATIPAPATHRDRVAAVIDMIDAGDAEKVVLARSLTLRADVPLDPAELLGNFAAGNPAGNTFGVDLSPCGDPDYTDNWFLGSTPELLIRKAGRTVTCHPYAGSAARQADPADDAAAGQALLDSAKDRAEHAFVVDYLRASLAAFCSELDAPTTPKLLSTNEIWHLATPITGTLRDDATTALDLALALTPTPAVGGTPKDAATAIIAKVEEPRGFYAGAVGWCDENGDGEWMVSIRCLQLAADRVTIQTWAGGGIVAASDPQAELDETTAKFRTVLRALGATKAL